MHSPDQAANISFFLGLEVLEFSMLLRETLTGKVESSKQVDELL